MWFLSDNRHKRLWSLIGWGVLIAPLLFIRVWNYVIYSTFWGDDGGAHVAYSQVLLERFHLPTFEQTYLAWHEPLYYALVSGVSFVSSWSVQHVGEFLQLVIATLFLFGVYCLSRQLSRKRLVAAAVVFATGIVFVGVKLSAYMTNELALHAAVVWLVYAFLRWQLHVRVDGRRAIVWAALVAVAMLIKLSAVIVFIAALLWWGILAMRARSWRPFVVVLASIAVVVMINAPWFAYKQQAFGDAFSINLYEQETKQAVLHSDGWRIFAHVSVADLFSQPYWETVPYGFVPILFADTVADYYNLFDHVDAVAALPASDTVRTTNRRYARVSDVQAMMQTYAVSLWIVAFWAVGLFVWLWQQYRSKSWHIGQLFVMLVVVGGVSALMYNFLRHPYVARGTLKMQFIFFVLPCVAMLAYHGWAQICRPLVLRFTLFFVPLFAYLYYAWPILLVGL